MKAVPIVERPFHPPDFEMVDPAELNALLGDKKIVVVEDLMSTGGSAYYFIKTLKSAGLDVLSLVALMGDPRLQTEPQLVSKLKKALKRAGVTVKAQDVSAFLPRGHIQVLFDLLNSIGAKDERSGIEITGRIQGYSTEELLALYRSLPDRTLDSPPVSRDKALAMSALLREYKIAPVFQ